MSLEMYLALLAVALLATMGFRWRMRTITTRTPRTFTAASITTIEAAFLRAGADGVEQVRRAANESGAQLEDINVDVRILEAGLAARGLAFDANARRALRNWRLTGSVVAAPAALVAAFNNVALAGSHRWEWSVTVEFAILWSGAAIALMGITHLGSSTAWGREALAMRRAAYPLALLRDADPTATVALYGGTLRRRVNAVSSGSTSGGGGDYVWSDSGGSGHGHDGSGGHSSSHSCASGCGSGGCGGG